MRKTLKNLAFAVLAVFTLASSASAQLTLGDFATLGDEFTIEINTFVTGGGAGNPNDVPGTTFNNIAIFDGDGETIGEATDDPTTPGVNGGLITASESFTDLGGGNFEIVFTVESVSGSDLAPNSTGTNDVARDNITFFIGGADLTGSNPTSNDLDVNLNHTITSAVIEIFTTAADGTVTSVTNVNSILGGGAFGPNEDADGNPLPDVFQGFLGAGSGSQGLDGIQNIVTLTLQGNIPTAVPEPTSLALLGGLGLFGLSRRRRR